MKFIISAASGNRKEEVKEINRLEELLEYVTNEHGIIIKKAIYDWQDPAELDLTIYDDWVE